MSIPFSHEPVLLDESIVQLRLSPSSLVVDGTLGGGGHAERILETTAPDGVLVGLDVDDGALVAARDRLKPHLHRVRLVRSSFRELRRALAELEIARVDAVLLDLGVSSHQLDTLTRGFRFEKDTADRTPLDMRMDRRAPATAADLLRTAREDELARWFRDYGELPGARRLARAIVEVRRRAPLRTAGDFLRTIHAARVGRGRRHNPATLAFQAVRIAVNDELGALEDGIEAAIEVLRPGGRAAVIAYHSLEDRLVKNHFRDAAKGCVCPPRTPVCVCGRVPRVRVVTPRPLRPSESEIRRNPRARSARMRVAERLGSAA